VALTLTLAILVAIVVPAYTSRAVQAVRPGYKLSTAFTILSTFGGGVIAGLLFWRSSMNLLMYLILCITFTGLLLTRGRPTDLFDMSMIYGYAPDDTESNQHDTVVGKKQVLYLIVLMAEALPVIVWAQSHGR
jgi:hypothetical protein